MMPPAAINGKFRGRHVRPLQVEASEYRANNTNDARFYGRLARGIENRFMNEMEADENAVMPFPAPKKFTRDIRNASAAKGSSDFLSLWAGTGQGELWQGPASELIGPSGFSKHLKLGAREPHGLLIHGAIALSRALRRIVWGGCPSVRRKARRMRWFCCKPIH